MITLLVHDYNLISQDFYDSSISSLQLHQLTCSCGRSAGLTIHGYYYRKVKFAESSINLKICRVKCGSCGKTHALLLSSMIPYSQILLDEQLAILTAYQQGVPATSVMEQTPSIDECHLRFIIRKFRSCWQQRLLSIPVSLHDSSLVVTCFSHFKRQFMQTKPTINLLFSSPT